MGRKPVSPETLMYTSIASIPTTSSYTSGTGEALTRWDTGSRGNSTAVVLVDAGTDDYAISASYLTGSIHTNYIQFPQPENYIMPSTEVRNWFLSNKSASILIEGTPTGLYFKPDGTRFYIIGQSTDFIRAYDLSVAWDIATSASAESASVVSQDTAMNDLFITSDGVNIFTVGDTVNAVFHYTASTPWYLNSIGLAKSQSVSSQLSTPTGLYFSPDGVYMYVVGSTSDSVYQYQLSTPWDINTLTLSASYNFSARETVCSGISFNNSGSRMYIIGSTGDDITEFRLSSPWDVSTSVYFSSGFTFTGETAPSAIYYNEDVGRCYALGTTLDTVLELITTPSAKFFGNSFVIDGQTYIDGRAEFGNTAYFNSTGYFLGTVTAASSLTVAGTLTSNSTTTLGSVTSAVVNSISNVVTTSGSRKSALICRSGSQGALATVELATELYGISNFDVKVGSYCNGVVDIRSTNNQLYGNTTISNSLSVRSMPDPLFDSPNGNIEIYDTFTEGSNTLLNLHTPETGSAYSKSYADGTVTMTVYGGAGNMGATATVADQGAIYINTQPISTPDYELKVDLSAQTSSDDVFWLFVRYQDNNNFYGLKWSTTAANCALVKRVNGTFTGLSLFGGTITTGATDLRLRVVGDIISVWNGGIMRMGIKDSTISGSGYAAVGLGDIGILSTDDTSTVWKVDTLTVTTYIPKSSTFDGGIQIPSGSGNWKMFVDNSGSLNFAFL